MRHNHKTNLPIADRFITLFVFVCLCASSQLWATQSCKAFLGIAIGAVLAGGGAGLGTGLYFVNDQQRQDGERQALAEQRAQECWVLNRKWRESYHRDFHVQWPLESFACPSDTHRIASALYHLEQDASRSRFFEILKRELKSLRKSTAGEQVPPSAQISCSEEVSAFTQFVRERNTAEILNPVIFLRPSFFQDPLYANPVHSAAVLIHQISHHRKWNPSHLECEAGDQKWECDAELQPTLALAGGYGFEVLYYASRLRQEISVDERTQTGTRMMFLLNHKFKEVTAQQKREYGRLW